jgi:hypothetical protein
MESNNSAVYTLISVSGCDSIITLDLTINTVDISVTVTDPGITANAIGAEYRWLDCNNAYAEIPGETAQTFIALTNGNYAVEITENGCTDTSECIMISTVGIVENRINIVDQVTIYPNPSRGQVNIDLGDLRDVAVSVISVNGQLIYQEEGINNKIHQFEIIGEPGIYFIEVFSKGSKHRFKLIKM